MDSDELIVQNATAGIFAARRVPPVTMVQDGLVDRDALSAPDAEEEDVWHAIEAFAGSGNWSVVLEIIEQREFDLEPWRMTALRVRALVELGWRRRALDQLVKAYTNEYIRLRDAVDLLVEHGALSLAALFVDRSNTDDPWRAVAHSSLMATVTRICALASVQEAPLQYADAIEAKNILLPGQSDTELALSCTLKALTERAAELLENGDPSGATRLLVAAVRLAPSDGRLLASLADASHRANLMERYFDTMLRIWKTSRDVSTLLATARGVLETSSWTMIANVMAIVAEEAESRGLEVGTVAVGFRDQARLRIDEYIRCGDVAAGLELAIRLSRGFPGAEWPEGFIPRLLRATKRRLRGQQAGDALSCFIGPLYLELAPLDVDVGRMLAGARMRQGRLVEARDLLDRVVTISPHVAGDWVMLALVQDEMGDIDGRDFSVARAILISPDVDLPKVLAPVREQMRLA
jgi:Flp pilus assembly protein TadD